MALTCTTQLSPERAVAAIAATGEVDLATGPKLRKAFAGVPDCAQTVVLDLAQVRFLDSTGLGILIGAHRKLESERKRLLVVNACPQVWRVFELTGLVESLRVHPAPEPPALTDPFIVATTG